MPLFMDVHIVEGVTSEALAKAHAEDLLVQGNHGVEYTKYWFNEREGKVFCLCHAPNAEAANRVHREAHGLEATRIIQVEPELVEAFLGAGPPNAAGAVVLAADGDRDTGTRTVLFTDIVGSTSLTQDLGDDVAMRVVQAHDKAVRGALAAYGGREVKHTGDGIMASFVSAAAAVRCAMSIQREVAEADGAPFQMRIGVASGEPVERRNDIFGSTVQLAARLCAHAAPAQILVSNVVAELCIGKQLKFETIGDVTLKGFAQPTRAHAVSWS